MRALGSLLRCRLINAESEDPKRFFDELGGLGGLGGVEIPLSNEWPHATNACIAACNDGGGIVCGGMESCPEGCCVCRKASQLAQSSLSMPAKCMRTTSLIAVSDFLGAPTPLLLWEGKWEDELT